MKGKIKITIQLGLPVDTKHYESDDLEGVAKELDGQYKSIRSWERYGVVPR